MLSTTISISTTAVARAYHYTHSSSTTAVKGTFGGGCTHTTVPNFVMVWKHTSCYGNPHIYAAKCIAISLFSHSLHSSFPASAMEPHSHIATLVKITPRLVFQPGRRVFCFFQPNAKRAALRLLPDPGRIRVRIVGLGSGSGGERCYTDYQVELWSVER